MDDIIPPIRKQWKTRVVWCDKDYLEDMKDYFTKYYNRKSRTNKTIKKPYGCCYGRKTCMICSLYDKNHSSKRRKKLRKMEKENE